MFLLISAPILVLVLTSHYYMNEVALTWYYTSPCILATLTVFSIFTIIMLFSDIKYMLSFMFMMMTLLVFFFTEKIMTFYIMFEFSLIPIVLLILAYGYQPERFQASMYMLLYTIFGSLPFLLWIMSSENWWFDLESIFSSSLTYSSLMLMIPTLPFLVKLPMWGLHLWLPKAHVQAPLGGSMILAGILLKLGGYGLLRVYLYMYVGAPLVFSALISANMWGVVLVSMLCLTLVDLKSIIAYSSIVHMALVILGVFSQTTIGYLGALIAMVSHGFSSPLLFMLANSNYTFTKTRNILLHKSIASSSPVLSLMWFLSLSANMAAPPSMNLVSEIMLSFSVFSLTGLLGVMAMGVATLLSGSYNLYIYSSLQGVTQIAQPFVQMNYKEKTVSKISLLLIYLAFLITNYM